MSVWSALVPRRVTAAVDVLGVLRRALGLTRDPADASAVRSQTRGRAATAVPDDPLHPVPSAAELQQQLIEIVDRLAIDEGNGAAFVEHVLAALRMWHVVVDLDFDALQRQADAAVREAETGQALAQARLAQARAELARAEHALRHGPAAPERHSPAVPMRRGRMPEEAP